MFKIVFSKNKHIKSPESKLLSNLWISLGIKGFGEI